MYDQRVKRLGSHFGPERTATTFSNRGLINDGSDVRRNYAMIELSMMGFLAGTVRLLRNPFFVLAARQAIERGADFNRLMFGHYGAVLAAIYGDQRTLQTLNGSLFVAHDRVVIEEALPSWFTRVTGFTDRFCVGEKNLMRSVTVDLVAAVAKVHQLTGLVIDDRGYCYDLTRSVLWAAGVNDLIPEYIRELVEVSATHQGIPLMDAATAAESGAIDMLRQLMAVPMMASNAKVTPQSFGQLGLDMVGGLCFPDDREVMGIPWDGSRDGQLAAYCKAMGDELRNLQHYLAGAPVRPVWDTKHVFAVALRGNNMLV